jgi:hypothetical protein
VPHPSGVTPEEVTELRAGIRNFGVDSVPGSGQFIHEEQPDAVVAAVAGLDEVSR